MRKRVDYAAKIAIVWVMSKGGEGEYAGAPAGGSGGAGCGGGMEGELSGWNPLGGFRM